MKSILFFAVATFWYAFFPASPAPAGDRSSDNLNLDVHIESSSTAAVELCFPTMDTRYVRVRGKHDSVHWVEKYAGVEVWGYPVPDVTWIYDSGPALGADITMQRGAAHPQDPVLFSSGASGVQSHSVMDGWLQIESGRGNGRVYWNYHEVPEFELLQNAGYNMAMTGTFKLMPGIRNLSIKDGNHGTDGWILDDSLAFGGFGLSIWRTHVQSKAEYWHNEQGSSYRSDYPNGLELVDNTEYRYFMTVRTRPRTEEVVLNVWLDFGSDDWIHVMQNRTWGKAGWSPGDVPDRSDKTAIVRGPYHIRRHHLWTRANGGGFLPVKDIRIGVLDPHP